MTDAEKIAQLERRIEALERWIQDKGVPAIKQLQEKSKQPPASPFGGLFSDVFTPKQ